MGKLNVDVLGAFFEFKSDEEDEYLEKLLLYYKEIVSKIESSMNVKDELKLSILAGMNLCDELYKEKFKLAKIAKKDRKAQKALAAQGDSAAEATGGGDGGSCADDSRAQEVVATLIDKLDCVLKDA